MPLSFDIGTALKPIGPTLEQDGPVIEETGPVCEEIGPIVEHESPSSRPSGTFSSITVTSCEPNVPILNHEGPAIEDEGPFTEDVVPFGDAKVLLWGSPMSLTCDASPLSRSEVHALLAELRTLLHQGPPSGPNYPAEAARDHAIAQMCQLPPGDDPFLVELLEEALAEYRREEKELGVCEAIIGALRSRDLRIAADVFGRIAMANPPIGWLSGWVVEILGKSNPRTFEAILRQVATGRSHRHVRAWAAEVLVAAGLATPSEIDAFLRDPDEDVRRLTTRGLAELGTPDAIVRLTEMALRHEDDRFRNQAWWLLGGRQLAPARGGRC